MNPSISYGKPNLSSSLGYSTGSRESDSTLACNLWPDFDWRVSSWQLDLNRIHVPSVTIPTNREWGVADLAIPFLDTDHHRYHTGHHYLHLRQHWKPQDIIFFGSGTHTNTAGIAIDSPAGMTIGLQVSMNAYTTNNCGRCGYGRGYACAGGK